MKLFYLFILLFSFSLPGTADSIMVKRVIDGDTFEAADGSKIRMLGINAPEIKDLMGQESKEHLKNLIEGKIVEIYPDHISKDKDRYNRLLRYVLLNGVDINKKMIEDGYAFAYPNYKVDRLKEYQQFEKVAKEKKIGIWNKPEIERVIEEQNAKESDYSGIFKIGTIALIGIAAIVGFAFFIGKKI